MLIASTGAGLGSDLTPLAQAIVNGQIQPTYIDGQYWQPSYKSTPELLNKYLYLDSQTAQQIASLLGGSVFQATPTDLGPNAESAPKSNWVRVGGDVFNAALATPQWLWGGSGMLDECTVEDLLALNVPGGQVSSTCAAKLRAAGMPVNGPGNANPEYIPPESGNTNPSSGTILTDKGGYQANTGAPVTGGFVQTQTGATTTNTGAQSTGFDVNSILNSVSNFSSGTPVVNGIPNSMLLIGAAVVALMMLKG